MTLEKDQLKAIRDSINDALRAVMLEHGLARLEAKNCTFSTEAGRFSFKVDGLVNGGVDADAERYQMYVDDMKLPPRGTVFRAGEKRYTITGMTKGGKILTSCGDKNYAWPVPRVLTLTKRKLAP